MSTTHVRYARTLHAQIRDAAWTLAEPTRAVVERDDGTTSTHRVAGLLDQLAGEHAPSAPMRGSRARGTGTPVALDVLDLHQTIRVEAAAWCWRVTGQAPPGTLPERVHAMAIGAGEQTDLQLLRDLLRCLLEWISGIRAVLEPPRRMELVRPCPECATTTVHRSDPATGEPVRRHALEVDGTHGADCLACSAHWPPEHLAHLALVIGCDPVSA